MPACASLTRLGETEGHETISAPSTTTDGARPDHNWVMISVAVAPVPSAEERMLEFFEERLAELSPDEREAAVKAVRELEIPGASREK